LLNFVDNYCEWHPAHIKANWEKGEPNEVGSIMYTEEEIKGELLKLRAKLKRLISNKLFEFKTVGSLKLLLYGGTFEIEPTENGSIFTATLDFRMGKLLSKLAKKSVGFITQHMIEEGENLKKILEK
jgi:hypothetical protein